MKKVFLTCVVATALLFGTVGFTSASAIRPVGGSSSDVRFGSIANVIDGVIDYDSFLGLGPDNNPIGSPYGVLTDPVSVRFDLGATFNLTGMDLWNNAGRLYNDGEGINAFTLDFRDNTFGLLGSYSGNAADVLTQQSFVFPAAINGVEYVDLKIHSNHSAAHPNGSVPANGLRDYVDFHEIQFTAVPEPATLMLIGLGLVGLAGVKRKIMK